MGTNPWFKFYPSDWRSDPRLRMCSLAARGLWMEMLSLMHEANPRGHLLVNGIAPTDTQLGVLAGSLPVQDLLDELERIGVFSRTQDGVIYSRRMTRDEAKAETAHVNGKAGGNPDLVRGTVPKEDRSRPFRRSDAPAKTEAVWRKTNGACWWCQKSLQRDRAGHDFFHVDHVVAIRDGGDNDLANLVPACAECNHARARHGRSDTNPDTNPQIPEARLQKVDKKISCPKRKRVSYPPEFEDFWKGYPTDANMSKLQAFSEWKLLGDEDQKAAIASLEAFQYYCRRNPDYRPVHANRYLKQRRFEGHLKAVEEVREKIRPKFKLQRGTPPYLAWNAYRKQRGEPEIHKAEWWFPTEYPPGHANHEPATFLRQSPEER